MYSIETARHILTEAGVFFGFNDEEDPELNQTLNMNDVWCWACSGGEYVPDEKLPEVTTLFFFYGFAGVMYWVSEQNNQMRSEFEHYNRQIDFVRKEEEFRKKYSTADFAYVKKSYLIGDKQLYGCYVTDGDETWLQSTHYTKAGAFKAGRKWLLENWEFNKDITFGMSGYASFRIKPIGIEE